MTQLSGRRILIGISGSIAAYKIAILVRLLKKADAEVRVIMTPAARDFISPLTMSTLSQEQVYLDISSEEEWNNHVDLGLWADLFVIAPATANTLAKLATGLADNMLVATYLSAQCPTLIAPAMDRDMWAHPSTKSNLKRLKEYGNHLIDVDSGFLASGLEGKGRMAEPEAICEQINAFFDSSLAAALKGSKVLLTSGPTREPLDPVRYLGNRSSGKMGKALANALLQAGAEVHLVSGPVSIDYPVHPRLHFYPVETTEEMAGQCKALFGEMQGAIMAAAVSDYRPKKVSKTKIKSDAPLEQVQLEKTPDIAATLGEKKQSGQWMMGFALETHDGRESARKKLKSKNLDWIVLNQISEDFSPFGADENRVVILPRDGEAKALPPLTKEKIAHEIVQLVVMSLATKQEGDL